MRFHDHHFHPLGYVGMVTGLDLNDAADFDDLARRLADRRDSIDSAIIGQRLNDEGLKERSLPDRALLDSVSPDRPILVYRYCGHIGIANSAALELAGIRAGVTDPDGGSFDRGPAGDPTGVIRETALKLVSDALSGLTTGPSNQEVLDALGRLEDLGIGSVTGMVSAGEPMWCGVGNELETLISLAPELPIDINVIVITDSPETLASAAERIRSAGGRMRFGGWKDFADGSLGGHTAAMYEPFADRPDEVGVLRLRPAHAGTMARASLELGGDVAIHAIGDRANDEVADFFEHLISNGADPDRLRVEHASILTERTVARFAALGITASIQPAFLASEEEWLERRLGKERMSRAYPFREMAEAGLRLLGGSDCPVEPPDPRIGIRAAVDRHGISPGQALTEDQAIQLFHPPDPR
ncbi:MAG: amidohydrolase family protein [Acidimicrobiia bacterium]